VLRAPEAAKAARPGQFVMLRVSENRDPLLARPFGIAAVLSGKSIEIYYRVAGRGTSLLTAAEPGSTLMMHGPLGNGFPMPGKDAVPVFVAGGSGFPPLLLFASRVHCRPYLFLGARNRECLPPANVIKTFKKCAEKVYTATENGSAGKQGLVTDLLASFMDSRRDNRPVEVYACGPRPMLAAVHKLAAEHSISCHVSMEERMACGVGACMGCSVAVKSGGYKRVCKEGPVFDSREIEWSEQIRLEMPNTRVRKLMW
jgi:dihydroorotate dehydrogenase electron transfer subunit